MKIKIALAASLVVSLIAGSTRVAAQEPPSLESRIAALENQLRDIETQLVKLDFIATEVGKLSGKQAPQLASGALKAAAADDVVADDVAADDVAADDVVADDVVADAADATSDALDAAVAGEPRLPSDDADDAEPSDTGDDELLSLFDADGQEGGPLADTPASKTAPPVAEDDLQPADSVAQRVTRIEQVATNIESRLKLLDDLAELVDALGRQTDTADSLRTAAKPAGAAAEASADATTAPRRGTLVINNWTGVVHWITVDDARFRVEPGRNRIPADYGALTTRVGDEEMQWDLTDWRNVGGNYELVLDLKP